MEEKIPGSSNALTFGILSIVLTLFCCGPFGAIFSFIGLNYAKKAKAFHEANPGNYSGYDNIQTGKILSYIGLALSVILLILTIIYFGLIIAFFATADFQ
ncbi:CCC motif membrane protein [Maribacter sp. LLG6340-A2]|uniref:CCC motif membrane protein n=1 Tax=Maribacter sp. LLG6340-A2 TaxID=3160834 RepID=UPI0038639BC8